MQGQAVPGGVGPGVLVEVVQRGGVFGVVADVGEQEHLEVDPALRGEDQQRGRLHPGAVADGAQRAVDRPARVGAIGVVGVDLVALCGGRRGRVRVFGAAAAGHAGSSVSRSSWPGRGVLGEVSDQAGDEVPDHAVAVGVAGPGSRV